MVSPHNEKHLCSSPAPTRDQPMHWSCSLPRHPMPPSTNSLAYDITLRGPYKTHALRRAVSSAAGAANLPHEEKVRTCDCTVRGDPSLTDMAAMPDLGFHFLQLALDMINAPCKRLVATAQHNTKYISRRSPSTATSVATRIGQNLSFIVWSSVALAILANTPVQTDKQSM